MHRSLFLSTISLAALSFLVGCSDDSCGPGNAPDTGLVAGDMDQKLTFGNMRSSANNDCPDPMAPSGVVSLTLGGTQTDGTGLITLCIPRPDKLIAGLQLGTEAKIIDLRGTFNGCDYAFEPTRPVSGVLGGKGVCNGGKDAAGWALNIDGHISLNKDCTTSVDTIAVNFTGTVAVMPQ